jgi:SNF2 family DNA or RNA helicase
MFNKTSSKRRGESVCLLKARGVSFLTHSSIIFSGWTRTLDLVERHLDQHSIPFRRIDGECTLPRRRKILNEFSNNSRLPVLIMTTGTGAFGCVLFPGQLIAEGNLRTVCEADLFDQD